MASNAIFQIEKLVAGKNIAQNVAGKMKPKRGDEVWKP